MALTIKAIAPTTYKLSPQDSASLPDDQKIPVGALNEQPISWYRDEGTHVKFALTKPYKGYYNWFAFDQHVQVLENGKVIADFKTPREIRLAVPYYSQRDNQVDAWRTCFSSSMAMAAQFVKPGCIKGDDHYISLLQGDTTDAAAQQRTLKSLGIPSQYTQSNNLDTLHKSLEAGLPVGIGYLHKGPQSAPSGGGHWALVVGRKEDKSGFWVHDPWGVCDRSGNFFNANGNYTFYDNTFMDARWTVYSQSDGWAMTFYG